MARSQDPHNCTQVVPLGAFPGHDCRTVVWILACGEATKGPPVHPPELAYPCCLPALGRFTRWSPHEGLRQPYPSDHRARPWVSWRAEDSPRGLGRTLGKRVGIKPSRVRISYPPPHPTSNHAKLLSGD